MKILLNKHHSHNSHTSSYVSGNSVHSLR
jgi:hypothetical protein